MNVADPPIFGLGLCAGGLGLELGLEIALPGYRAIGLVEREVTVAGRMAARMAEGSIPQTPLWDDCTTFDGRPFRGLVSIVSAGFPCQPFSVAGKRKGTEDARWIWPDIARIIGEVAPEIVFLENVPGLLLDPSSDIDRWEMEEQPDDSLGGMGTVLRDLAGLGFDAEWCCVRASDVGASHGRKRVFILAYRDEHRGKRTFSIEWPVSRSVRESRELGNAERTERWPSAIGSGCDRAGIDREGEASSRAGNGEPVLADSANSGPSLRRNDLGIRERSTAERASSELGDSESGRFGIVRKPSGGIGQSDGAVGAVGYSKCSRADLYGAESGSRNTTSESDSELGHAGSSERDWLSDVGREEMAATRDASAGLPIFAPGPSDPRWQDLLVQRPWLRPSWSQAEVESALCDMASGLASVVVNDRTTALRVLGNGVVPLQAALAFVLLARRARLIATALNSAIGTY